VIKQKNITYLFYLLFSLSSLYIKSQSKLIDSLNYLIKQSKEDTSQVLLLNALSSELGNISETSKAIITVRKSISLSQRLNYKKGFANACKTLGSIYLNINDLPKALDFLYKSLKAFENINDKTGIAANYNNIGLAYYYQRDFDNALVFYLKSLTLKEALNDKKGIANSYTNLSSIYIHKGDYFKALDLLYKGLKIKKEIKNKRGICTSSGAISGFFIDIFDKSDSIKELVIPALNNVWQIQNTQKINLKNINQLLLDSAFEIEKRTLVLAQDIGDKIQVAYCLKGMAYVYEREKKYKEAITYFLKSAKISDSIKAKLLYGSTASSLYECYVKLGSYKEAFNWLLIYKTISDTANSQENKKAAMKQGIEFEYEKQKALDLKDHEKQMEVSVEKEKKQKVISYCIAVGLILALLLSLFIINRLRITRKQKGIIELQKKLVEEKQKEVFESITYAKRLQEAILPPQDFINKYIPHNFVLYKPKDIVAGDFYWAEKINNLFFIAAADSTGHGVPGAMVSVVCSNALNRSVKEFRLTETGKILDKTRELVLETFEKSTSDVKDGMDISLLCIDLKTKNIFWSGANNSLLYITNFVSSSTSTALSTGSVENNELKEIKADKQPIGKTDNPKPFTTHKIPYEENTTFYLFTDGFADQFGGPNGKKFKYKQIKEILLANFMLTPNEQKLQLNILFEKWKGSLEQIDDVCIIGLRI